MNADELMALAVATRDDRNARERRMYELRWRRFFECELCGKRPMYAPDQATIPYHDGLRCLLERCYCDGVIVLVDRGQR